MRLMVSRTSSWGEKPCEEAKLECYTKKCGDGTTTDNYKRYVVRFNSLQDVLRFIQKYGEVVMGYDEGQEMYTVEIYDVLRE